MKQFFSMLLVIFICQMANAQIPTPAFSYLFTNGNLGDLVRYGTAMTATEDRMHSTTDALMLNGDCFSRGQNNTSSLSVSFWIRSNNNDGAKKTIIDQSNRVGGLDNNPKGWYTYLKNGRVGLAANFYHAHDLNGSTISSTTGYVFTEASTPVADGYWHNVVVSAFMRIYFDGIGYIKSYTYKIYVDGVMENTQTIIRGSGGSFSNITADLCWATPVTIANNQPRNLNASDRYADELDDINFYARAISDAEALELANENNCPYPKNVNFSSVTVTSAIVNWDASFDGQSWDLTYVESGQPIGNGTTIAGITGTSQFLNGLSNNTAYDVYLTSNCTSFSGFASPANTFTTLCQSTSVSALTQNLTVQLDENGAASITAAQVDNNSVDACGTAATVLIDVSSFDCSKIGDNTVTLSAFDGEGNSATATAIVTVLPPALAQDITAYLDATGNVSITAADIDNGSNAVCGSNFTLAIDQNTFSCAELGANTINFTVDNGAGFIGTATAVVTVEDTLAPTVITQDITLNLDASFQAQLIPSMINNGSTDNCSGALTYALSKTIFDCDDQGVNQVTLMVTDPQGNVGTGVANVTINPIINTQTVTADQTDFCTGSGTSNISTTASQGGVTYYLRKADGTVLDGPVTGTGAPLSFTTGVLSNSEEVHVYGEKSGTGGNNFALSFDGVDDKVSTNFKFPATGTFTIECWLKPLSGNYDRIISNFASTGNNPGEIVFDTYHTVNNGRGLRLYLVGAGSAVHQLSINDVLTIGAWNHVAATFTNGTVRLYVGGVQVAISSAPFTTIPASPNGFCFGEDFGVATAEYLNGSLDDVRFWNTARTPTELIDNSNVCLQGNEAGLLAYYNFDEGTGTTAADKLGNNDGTFSAQMTNTAWDNTSAFSCAVTCGRQVGASVQINISQPFNGSETVNVCSGADYTYPDGTVASNVTAAATYTSTLQTPAGCDSIITTNLEVLPVYNQNESISICAGTDYTFHDGNVQTAIMADMSYTSSLTSISGCDSIIVTNLTVLPAYRDTLDASVCEGASYSFPDGTQMNGITSSLHYTSTFATLGGCDSVIVTRLTVMPVYNLSETIDRCAGSDYTFPDGTVQSNIQASMSYTSSLTTLAGCDSIIVTNINVLPVYHDTATVNLCTGSDYTFPDGNTLTALTQDTLYLSAMQTLLGCDSLLYTQIVIKGNTITNDTVQVCPGASYTMPDGTVQSNITADLSYTSLLTSVDGCDSTVVTQVMITPVYNLSETVSVCSGNNYTFADGTVMTGITANLTYTSHLFSVTGCDSIIETTVNVVSGTTVNETVSVCSGSDFIAPDGTVLTNLVAPMVYTSVLIGANGCDSTIVTDIQLFAPVISSEFVNVCFGASYQFPDGSVLSGITSDLIYTSTLTGANGCDSLVETQIVVSAQLGSNETVSVCRNSSYTFPDGHIESNIAADLTYTSSLISAAGCDSMVVTTVLVNQVYQLVETVALCAGSDYVFPDGHQELNIQAGMSYTSSLTTMAGCDSTINTIIDITVPDMSVNVLANGLEVNQFNATYQWINCFDNSIIFGAEGRVFFPTVTGSYACIVNMGSCSDTTACTEFIVAGMDDLDAAILRVWPNPSTDFLNIESSLPWFKASMFSLTGELMMEFDQDITDISTLPVGAYVLKVNMESGEKHIRFIKL